MVRTSFCCTTQRWFDVVVKGAGFISEGGSCASPICSCMLETHFISLLQIMERDENGGERIELVDMISSFVLEPYMYQDGNPLHSKTRSEELGACIYPLYPPKHQYLVHFNSLEGECKGGPSKNEGVFI